MMPKQITGKTNAVVSFLIALLLAPLAGLRGGVAQAADNNIAECLQKAMIWTKDVPPGKQAYVAFRKTFTLTQAPSAAQRRRYASVFPNSCSGAAHSFPARAGSSRPQSKLERRS